MIKKNPGSNQNQDFFLTMKITRQNLCEVNCREVEGSRLKVERSTLNFQPSTHATPSFFKIRPKRKQ